MTEIARERQHLCGRRQRPIGAGHRQLPGGEHERTERLRVAVCGRGGVGVSDGRVAVHRNRRAAVYTHQGAFRAIGIDQRQIAVVEIDGGSVRKGRPRGPGERHRHAIADGC